MIVTLVTGVRHKEQPGDLEAGEGAHVTVVSYPRRLKAVIAAKGASIKY